MPESRTPTHARIPQVVMRIVADRTVLCLKSWEPRHAAGEPIVLNGRELPKKAGLTIAGSPRVLCTGPGDWLAVSEEHDAEELSRLLGLVAEALVYVDVSDGLQTLEIQGPGTRELLGMGCGLDLDVRRFPPGSCARTRLAQIAVVLECRADPDRIELFVARSLMPYLKAWLEDAAASFQRPAHPM